MQVSDFREGLKKLCLKIGDEISFLWNDETITFHKVSKELLNWLLLTEVDMDQFGYYPEIPLKIKFPYMEEARQLGYDGLTVHLVEIKLISRA